MRTRSLDDAGLASDPLEVVKSDARSQVCLDLLHAKMESLDRGVPFAVPNEDLCERCRSMFAGLDLGRDACINIRAGNLPEPVAARLREHIGVDPSS